MNDGYGRGAGFTKVNRCCVVGLTFDNSRTTRASLAQSYMKRNPPLQGEVASAGSRRGIKVSGEVPDSGVRSAHRDTPPPREGAPPHPARGGFSCASSKCYRATQPLTALDALPLSWHWRVMLLSERVLFLDGEAMILDKPAGLPVTAPRSGALSVESFLESLCFGFHRWPMIVHRLDQDTSGCLLLARNPKAQKRFNAAFEAGGVEKVYLAVLDGEPADDAGVIDMPLGKISNKRDGWRMVSDPNGKAAVTHWRVLERVGGKTLVEFKPENGRTHQLRVHAASGLGLPILGDPLYGAPGRQMLLHASSLSVPRGDKPPAAATSPLPESFHALGFGHDG
jgi:tRNA pseudouridine32 synthase / 23S rRNA pseudouridine746 synthase